MNQNKHGMIDRHDFSSLLYRHNKNGKIAVISMINTAHVQMGLPFQAQQSIKIGFGRNLETYSSWKQKANKIGFRGMREFQNAPRLNFHARGRKRQAGTFVVSKCSSHFEAFIVGHAKDCEDDVCFQHLSYQLSLNL